jgi:hypothetical protein
VERKKNHSLLTASDGDWERSTESPDFLTLGGEMNTAAEVLDSKEPTPGREIPAPELGPALKRDRLLQKVRAARSKLSPPPSATPKLR